MKRLFLVPAIVFLLISCLNGVAETSGIPKIENVRILGYDRLSGEFVEKYTFHNSWDNMDLPYLEFTVYDDGIDINEVTITLDNDTYPNGKRDFVFALYQYTNPQICRYQIPVTQDGMTGQNNLWYLQFFVTDKNGKRSKTHRSDTFTILPN
jgi:hypothetical protein